MQSHTQKTAPFGEVVMAVFDEAAHYSTDPKVVARLATTAVVRILQRAWRTEDVRSRLLPTRKAGGTCGEWQARY